jgi:hypothetical protein
MGRTADAGAPGVIRAELVGGPRDGELVVLPSPAPSRLEYLTYDSRTGEHGAGTYTRDPALRFRGTMVRYNWKGWETR